MLKAMQFVTNQIYYNFDKNVRSSHRVHNIA